MLHNHAPHDVKSPIKRAIALYARRQVQLPSRRPLLALAKIVHLERDALVRSYPLHERRQIPGICRHQTVHHFSFDAEKRLITHGAECTVSQRRRALVKSRDKKYDGCLRTECLPAERPHHSPAVLQQQHLHGSKARVSVRLPIAAPPTLESCQIVPFAPINSHQKRVCF